MARDPLVCSCSWRLPRARQRGRCLCRRRLCRHARQERGIASHAEQIFRSPASFVAGNPNGDVSVVAFFDYNCPYCRQGAPDLAQAALREDGKVRLVLKELPVLGKDSEEVARVALAAAPQGKYLESQDTPPRRRRSASPESLASIRRVLECDPREPRPSASREGREGSGKRSYALMRTNGQGEKRKAEIRSIALVRTSPKTIGSEPLRVRKATRAANSLRPSLQPR